MKAELKGIKVYDRMSEETICYTATLYLDGNKAYFTSHGYPFTLRLIMDGKHTWMASKTDSDADAARMVAECETKNKTKVLSWKWI